MPSQLVKYAFGFRSFNDPKTKCVPLSVELGSEQGEHVPPMPPSVAGPELEGETQKEREIERDRNRQIEKERHSFAMRVHKITKPNFHRNLIRLYTFDM